MLLQTFAYVIAITMAIGILYAYLFLVPALALLGPDDPPEAALSSEWPFWKQALFILYLSKALRFLVAAAFLVALLVRTAHWQPSSAIWGHVVLILAFALQKNTLIASWRLTQS